MAELSETVVLSALKLVIDPEIGLNVVDLGLVYDVVISAEGDVHIDMTLTTPGCPLHDAIHDGVRRALAGLEGLGSVDVNIVWSPPWSPEMITEEGQRALGWA